MKTRFLLTLLATCVWFSGHAQLDLSVYSATGRGGVATTFVTDYQALGINPASLGYKRSFKAPKYTLGLLEINTTFYAEALSDRKSVV